MSRAQGWEIKELIKNAKNEAAMQQELAHPNVIDLEEMFVDEDAGTVYMVGVYGGESYSTNCASMGAILRRSAKRLCARSCQPVHS